MKKFFIFIWELVKIVAISLAIIIPVRFYLIQPFFVRGASMEPNFDDGEYLVIDEISYRFRNPSAGEVIVFKFPKNPSQYYIKRIIGLPGQTVEIRDNQVLIDGMVLDELLYLSKESVSWGDIKIKLGDNEYFVLGDNRSASSDSRQWGLLPQKFIIGRVWLRAWPFNKIEIFNY